MRILLGFLYDDIILISNTRAEMQKLIKVVEEYGVRHENKFNPSKTACLEISSRNSTTDFSILKIDDAAITKVDSIKYLGNIINEKLSNHEHIRNRIKLAFAAIEKLKKAGYQSNIIRSKAEITMYKSFVRPVLINGLETVKLKKNEIMKITRSTTTDLVNIQKRCMRAMTLLKHKLIKDHNSEEETKKIREIMEQGKSNESQRIIDILRCF